MKKIVAVVFCALSIVLLVTVIQKSGIVQNAGSQLAQVSYSPIPQTSPINPTTFFQFEGVDMNASSVGVKQLSSSASSDVTPSSVNLVSGGQVGKFIRIPYENSPQRLHVSGGTGFTNEFTLEFMFRPGRGFNNTEFFREDSNGSVDIRFTTTPSRGNTMTNANHLSFKTKTADGVVHDLSINMNGANERSWAYYTDGDWHHIAFVRKSDGTKQIWVDGTLPDGFSATSTGGNLISGSSTGLAFFNTTSSNRKYVGDLDEIAFHPIALPGNLINQHYSDFLAGVAYQSWTPITSVAQGGPTTGTYDPLNYAPGAVIDPNASYTTGITDKPLVQLQKYPLPRYKSGHTLLPNILWADMQYQAQVIANAVNNDATVASNSYNIMKELAQNFGYAITINNVKPGIDFTPASASTKYMASLAKLANDYPNLPLAVITYRTQINPKLKSQTLPNDHYLQNSSGQFINVNSSGSVITVSAPDKIWRPASTSLISSYSSDGDTIKTGLQNLMTALPARVAANPTKVIDLINDNGEIIHGLGDTLLGTDPLVVSEASQAGISLSKYMSRKYAENVNQAFSGRFMTLAGLQNTKYTEYPHEGGPSGRLDWSEVRNVNSTINGQKYATGDFYPCWPQNWKFWTAAWHGWGWFNESLVNQRAAGDKFSSIFISAGWWTNATKNYTPGQYLGLIKNLANAGSEFFYTGFFNNTTDCSWAPVAVGLPESYTWQNSIAPYVQALISRVDTFYKTSDLMQGDAYIHLDNASTLGLGYSWLTNDPNALVVVRKSNTGNKYLISANLNQSTNLTGNVEAAKKLTIKLGGNDVTFEARRQGSMYIYDNTNTSVPVFYQLDAWHEATHPGYWSKNFLIDAELNDSGTATIKTTGYTGRDFSQADSYVNASGNLGYTFQPRLGSGTTFYLWARARASSGTATLTANVDGGSSLSTTFSQGGFQWIKLPGSFSSVSIGTNHTLNLGLVSTLDLDKVILTPDASFVPSGGASTDTVAPTVPTNLTSPLQTSNSIDLTWTASTDNVGVVGYDIYKNSVFSGTASGTAYTLTGLTPSTVYAVSVKARDSAGNLSNASTTLQATTLASVDTQAPTVPGGLTSSNLSHNGVTISWTPSTDNVGVDAYEVTMNTTVLTSNLTTTTYTATGLSASTPYAFKVRAKDVAGNWSAYSSVLNITTPSAPDTQAPIASVTSPTSGAVLSGTVPITVSASDNVALDHIDFYRTSNVQIGSVVATGTSGSYTYQWNTNTVSNSIYGVYAKVYDTSGNVVTTPTVTISVNNVVVPPPDTTAPTVSITAPTSNQTVSGIIAIDATATDNVGVTKVEFYRGSTLIDTDTTSSPYQVPLNTTLLSNGTYSLTAKAFDAAGNTTTSTPVSIVVNNIAIDSTAPVVLISSPAASATVTGATVNLVANATDNVGITAVTFYKSDDTVLGTGTSTGSNNYTFVWNSTSTTNGTFTFYAKAYDAAGNFSQSSNRSVTVNNNDTVWPSAVTGLVVTNISNTTVTLSWNPSTDNVALMGYDVWKDSNTGANRYVTGAPGTSYTISGLSPNTSYLFGVQARDTSNNTSQPPATVTVTTSSTDTVVPVTAIVSPAKGTKFNKGTTVTFTANATDNVGVTKVEFRQAHATAPGVGAVICTDTTAPYTCDWVMPQTLLNTSYSFRTRAFDAAGNVGSSEWTWVRSK
jgi:chitodextrinase